ncbi:hypothetical protein BY458DRAFT_545209 [Sporodiniella umbellata]|nr:hypothetical protein BY458DRAFT_545209 [Sporodiniella umbellata]
MPLKNATVYGLLAFVFKVLDWFVMGCATEIRENSNLSNRSLELQATMVITYKKGDVFTLSHETLFVCMGVLELDCCEIWKASVFENKYVLILVRLQNKALIL